MKIENLLVIIIIKMICGYTGSQAQDLRLPNKEDPFEKIIIDEKIKLDKGFNFVTPVWISITKDIQADPDHGIIINPEQVKKHIREGNFKDTAIVIRLILAHEKGHSNQFLYYSKDQLNTSDGTLRKLIECQADILAGKYLYESFILSKVKEMATDNYTDSNKRAGAAGLELFFNIGENNYVQRLYPSKEQRRTAFKVGRIYGSVNQQIEYLNQYWDTIHPDSRSSFQQNIANGSNSIAITAGEPIMDWSFREAKRIVHYSDSELGNLVFTLKHSEWHASPDHPFWDYEYQITNNAAYPLQVDFDIRIDRVLREDPFNTFTSDIFNAHQYFYNIEPGGSVSLTGSLKWNFYVPPGQENKHIPLAVFAGSPASSLSAERLGTKSLPMKGGEEFNLISGEDKATGNFLLMLEKIRSDAAHNFKNLVVGPGLKDSSSGSMANFTAYNCFSAYSDIQLIVPDDQGQKPRISYFLGEASSYEQGKVIFDKLIQNISEGYQAEMDSGDLTILIQEEKIAYTYKNYRFTHPVNSCLLFVNLIKNKLINNYGVYVNVVRGL